MIRNRPILIIDDDPQVCELVTDILTGADFDVISAPNGPAGVELARVTQPAVIILDMMMPESDGLNTLTDLKRDPLLKDIPVIGITASTDLTYTARSFRAGAHFFLPKPFRAASLLRVVELAADAAQRHTPMHRRRRHPRRAAEVAVRCFVPGEAETTRQVAGQTGNVSLGGLLLMLPETLHPGTDLRLALGLPEGPITAKGMVMWQDPKALEDGTFRHGIQFLGFTQEAGLAQYRNYVSQIAVSPPP